MITHRASRLLLLFLLASPACATLDEGAVFDRDQLTDLFVRWREAERRRDVDLAMEVLYFEKGADKDCLEEEFEGLRGEPAGQVKAAMEIHLVGHPEDWGPGEYLYLEPERGRYIPTRAHVVSWRGTERIVYEPPLVTWEERRDMDARAAGREQLRGRIAFWEALEGDELAEQVSRLRTLLRYQQQAMDYASREDLPLVEFNPDPGFMLLQISSLDDVRARAWIVAKLMESLR